MNNLKFPNKLHHLTTKMVHCQFLWRGVVFAKDTKKIQTLLAAQDLCTARSEPVRTGPLVIELENCLGEVVLE